MASRPVGDGRGRSRWVDEAATTAAMYPDLTPADAHWAFERLRPQGQRSQREPHPGGLPGVPAVSIVGSHDRVVNPAWSRRVTRERLGSDPIELDAGHFPMITAPEALAGVLARLAR
jgi:pimeloyl-ACP methyl ester carboxylesterase